MANYSYTQPPAQTSSLAVVISIWDCQLVLVATDWRNRCNHHWTHGKTRNTRKHGKTNRRWNGNSRVGIRLYQFRTLSNRRVFGYHIDCVGSIFTPVVPPIF